MKTMRETAPFLFGLVILLITMTAGLVGIGTWHEMSPATVEAQTSDALVRDSYYRLRGTVPGLGFSAVTAVADTALDADGIVETGVYAISNRANNTKLAIAPSFSSAGAECVVTVCAYHKTEAGAYVLLGVSGTRVLTASPKTEDGGSRYVDDQITVFDTYAAPVLTIRLDYVSAGNVSIRPWTFGALSEHRAE